MSLSDLLSKCAFYFKWYWRSPINFSLDFISVALWVTYTVHELRSILPLCISLLKTVILLQACGIVCHRLFVDRSSALSAYVSWRLLLINHSHIGLIENCHWLSSCSWLPAVLLCLLWLSVDNMPTQMPNVLARFTDFFAVQLCLLSCTAIFVHWFYNISLCDVS